MFQFDFDIEGGETAETSSTSRTETAGQPSTYAKFAEIPLNELLDSLPALISYSPLSIALNPPHLVYSVSRRDLYDARFQLISDADQVTPATDAPQPDTTALKFIDEPSDIVPTTYEGGLKTWECSIDLVQYLAANKAISRITGKRVLEVGCGTAIPSLYLLREFFNSASSVTADVTTELHFQDYNEFVFELVTLPNILLAWYMSTESATFRDLYPSTDQQIPTADPAAPGDLPISPALKEEFLSSLERCKLRLRFFKGSWETFDLAEAGGVYDLVLTSETIYRPDCNPSLVTLLSTAAGIKTVEELAKGLNLSESSPPQRLCLVAAKVLYFGVGGGISDFSLAVQKAGGTVKCVWEKPSGVARQILCVG